MNINEKRNSIQRLIIFLFFIIIFLIVISILYINKNNPTYLLILMTTPTISVLITKIINKETFKEPILFPQIRQNILNYALAYLAIPFIAYLGAILFFLIFPDTFHPLLSKFAFQNHIYTLKNYFQNIFIIIPLCILINPIGGLIPSFGEEYAWRGYLLTNLCKIFNKKTAILLTGLIWGIWHAPIIYTGFNYGTDHRISGILMMVLFCSVINIILSFSFLKTKTIWIPVIIHASINAIDNYTPVYLFGSRFIKYNYFVGPNLVGIIGGMGLIMLAVIFYIRIDYIAK